MLVDTQVRRGMEASLAEARRWLDANELPERVSHDDYGVAIARTRASFTDGVSGQTFYVATFMVAAEKQESIAKLYERMTI